MPRQPFPDLGVLVGGVIVEDDVNCLAGRDVTLERAQEADERLVPVALHVARPHRALEHPGSRPGQAFQRGEQGGRAPEAVSGAGVTNVIMGHGGAATLLQRQSRLGAVEGMNRRLLVDRQHHGMGRRVHVKPDHGMKLVREGGVVRELEAPPAMRREAMRLPDLLDGGHRQPGRLGHGARRPVRGLVRRRKRQVDHFAGPVIGNRRDARRARPVPQQAVHALMHEALLPAPHRALRGAGRSHDRVGTDALGAEQMIRARQTCF